MYFLKYAIVYIYYYYLLGFLVTPNVCGNYVDDYYSNENDGTSTYLIVGIIIGVGFLLFGIFLFIYTRLAKR